jgi:hypothetical protein
LYGNDFSGQGDRFFSHGNGFAGHGNDSAAYVNDFADHVDGSAPYVHGDILGLSLFRFPVSWKLTFFGGGCTIMGVEKKMATAMNRPEIEKYVTEVVESHLNRPWKSILSGMR